MKVNEQVVAGNEQILACIQGHLEPKEVRQKETIKYQVKDKYDAIPFTIEVNENTAGQFILYRVITSAGEGFWSTWDSPDDVHRMFQAMSLI